MCTCAYNVYMYVCLEWCTCPCGGQRATPGIIPQSLPTMCFEDRVSHWPGICQGGGTSPRDPPASGSPVLSLQTHTTMPRFFCFALFFPVGEFCYLAISYMPKMNSDDFSPLYLHPSLSTHPPSYQSLSQIYDLGFCFVTHLIGVICATIENYLP